MKINFDNKILIALSEAFDCVLLAFYWMVCSIPVITVGASTTAILSVMLDVDVETGSVTKRFFRAFKSNFKISTFVWITFFALGALFALDAYVCWGGKLTGKAEEYLRATTIVIGVAYFMALSIAFGVIAKFNVSYRQVFYNVLVISVQSIKWVILLAVLAAAIIASLVCLSAFGFVAAALFFYLQAKIYLIVFKPYLPAEETDIPETLM